MSRVLHILHKIKSYHTVIGLRIFLRYMYVLHHTLICNILGINIYLDNIVIGCVRVVIIQKA